MPSIVKLFKCSSMALYVTEVERGIKECLCCGESHGTLRFFQLEDYEARVGVLDPCAKNGFENKVYDARRKKWIKPTWYFHGVNPPEHRQPFYLHYNCTKIVNGMVLNQGIIQCKPTYAYKPVAHFKREVKLLIKEKLGKKALSKFDYLLKPDPKFFCNIRTHTTKSGCEWFYLLDYCWWVQEILNKLKDEMNEMVFHVASVVNPPESYRNRKQAKKPRKASIKPRRESIDPTLLWKLDPRAIQTIYDFIFLEKGWDWTVNVEKVREDGAIFRNNIIGTIAGFGIQNVTSGTWMKSYLRKIIRDSMGFTENFTPGEERPKNKHVRVEIYP